MTSRHAGPGYVPNNMAQPGDTYAEALAAHSRNVVAPGYTHAKAQAAHSKNVAGPGYTPAPQRAMGGDPQRSHTIPASQSTFTYNGQTIDLNALRQQTLAFGQAGYSQQQNYLAGLQQQMASQPANYGYDPSTNAKLDAYIKSGGKGTPESYGLGANLLNTPGFEDPLGTEAARINARETATSPDVIAVAKQQYEDVKAIAMAQNEAFNRQHNPYYQPSISENQGDGIQYDADGRPLTNIQMATDQQIANRQAGNYTSNDDTHSSSSRSSVDNAVGQVTDSQQARNRDDTNASMSSNLQYQLQRPPDQLYYIQGLGQCLNRQYSGSGIFVDD